MKVFTLVRVLAAAGAAIYDGESPLAPRFAVVQIEDRRSIIPPSMPITDQVTKDMTAAMKARDEQRLSTLRMVKTALKNKEIDKRAPLDDSEAMQVLSTLIKQRKDSIEAFTKGGRQDMADKEAAEIKIIEGYLPQAVGPEEIAVKVRETIAEMQPPPTIKEMGSVMKAVMAKFAGARVDGKAVSDAVKSALTPKA